MKRKRMYGAGAVLLAVLLGLAACGGSAKSSSATMAAAIYDAAAETAVYEEGMERINLSADKGSGMDPASASLTDQTPVSQALPSGRKLIRNVTMTVETDEFDQLLGILTAQVGDLGGYVEQSDISGNSLNDQNVPIPRYASLTVRLPIGKLDGFVSAVEQNGNVTNRSESAQDVTLQYSDLESRKKSLTVEQDRIWALLEKADTLESVIALEERLSEIRYQLESMESQLRLYDNQVDYSTVRLSINEIKGAASFTPTEPEGLRQRIQKGFSKNLNSVSQGLTNFLIWLIASSPFWIPLAVIAVIVLLVVRRNKKRTIRQHLPHSVNGAEKTGKPEE